MSPSTERKGGSAMKAWKANEVKEHFSEILDSCYQEPQLVCERNDPVAVLVNIQLYKKLISQQHREKRPTMQQLLNEIHSIVIEDSFEIDIPKRNDRLNSTDGIQDELPM